jgi:hypothetical protein
MYLKIFKLDTYIKIQSLNEPVDLRNQIVRSKQKLLQTQITNYKSGIINRFHFVKCASHLHKV